MPNFFGVGGAYRPVKQRWIGVGGQWRPVKQRWIGVGGQWRPTIQSDSIAIPSISLRAAGRRPLESVAYAMISFLNTGVIFCSYTSLGQQVTLSDSRWAAPGVVGSEYEICFLQQAGGINLGGGLNFGQWYRLNGSRAVETSANATGIAGGGGAGPTGGSCLIRIRRYGSTTVLGEATMSLSAVVYPQGTSGGIAPGRDKTPDFYFQQH